MRIQVIVPLVLGLGLIAAPAQAASKAKATSLSVTSNPSGAAVWLDGDRVGRTPLKLNHVVPGEHTVVLSLPNRQLTSRKVNVKRGRNAPLNVRLSRATPLQAGEKELRLMALSEGQHEARFYELLGTLGSPDFGGFPDELFDLPSTFTMETDEEGNSIETTTWYLDPELTQVAGVMTSVLHLDLSTVTDYSFTAGPLAGASGHSSLTFEGEDDLVLDSVALLQDGTRIESHYEMNLSLDDGMRFLGSAVVSAPDGRTAHWEVVSNISGSHLFLKTLDGLVLEITTNPDASGSGWLLDADGTPLEVFSWNSDGVGTITYSDGTTEEFDAFAIGF
jgi:hypothetical protein